MLAALGYEVVAAKGGKKAVEIYGGMGAEIDLVILDMIMPGMSGGETFDALKAIDSSVRIILSSGYSLDGKSGAIMERGCRGFMQKPSDLQTLSAKVREALDSTLQE